MDGIFVGLMCGTSVDAVDAIAVRWENAHPVVLGALEAPVEPALRTALLGAMTAPSLPLTELYRLDAAVAIAHADATNALLQHCEIAKEDVVAIGFHGQTLHHAPNEPLPFTVQIGDPNRLAALCNVPVVGDVRRADMALGGQGAPLAPGLHATLFTHETESRAILNLGGIANLTLLSPGGEVVFGFDTGPANALLDAYCAQHTDMTRDQNGALAASGEVNPVLLTALLNTPYFTEPPPKSTGREFFNLNWLQEKQGNNTLSVGDMLATLTELTATSVASALKATFPQCQRVMACGGGRHNAALMRRLEHHLACPLDTTDDHGYDGDSLEAMLMAWIARQRVSGATSNLPTVTGASAAVSLGGLYQPG